MALGGLDIVNSIADYADPVFARMKSEGAAAGIDNPYTSSKKKGRAWAFGYGGSGGLGGTIDQERLGEGIIEGRGGGGAGGSESSLFGDLFDDITDPQTYTPFGLNRSRTSRRFGEVAGSLLGDLGGGLF